MACFALRRRITGGLLGLLTLTLAATSMAEPLDGLIADRLAAGELNIAGRLIDPSELRTAYLNRDHRPLWFDAGGEDSRALELLAVLRDAEREGLDPADYGPDAVLGLLESDAPEQQADAELLLSTMLLRYAADLRHGRLAPRTLEPTLFVQPRVYNATALLTAAAEQSDLRTWLRDRAPGNPLYRRLRRALTDYRSLVDSGGWQPLADGPALKPGMEGPAVAALRQRLILGGWLTKGGGPADRFDAGLELALRHFQRSHVLEADGVVGAQTRAALNVPARERMRQIILNMERWRWMPDDLGDFYVMVNMAAYELEVIDSGQVRLAMRVVVGKPYRRTPVFSDRIRYLEFNPKWTVPVKIASQDLVPKEVADPGYLQRHGFHLFDGWTNGAPELNLGEVDWRSYLGRKLPYRLVQEPGPKNALGRVKFMFPNVHDVYLHDTAAPELFSRTQRSFSSGCIRVEKPQDLAVVLLQDTPGWDRPAVEAVFADSKTRVVTLSKPVPVYLTYSTAWLGESGTLHFAPDIYARDAPLYAALFK